MLLFPLNFLFRHFVCPSISALLFVWLSRCDDNNLFYIPVVSFLVETGQGRLSVPGHIHQRQTLIGLWCNLLYGWDELGYLFLPLQPSSALSQPSETQQEKQPLDLMGSKGYPLHRTKHTVQSDCDTRATDFHTDSRIKFALETSDKRYSAATQSHLGVCESPGNRHFIAVLLSSEVVVIFDQPPR